MKFWRDYENQLFEIMRIVNNTMYTNKIPYTDKFNVNFAEMDTNQSPEEKRKDQEYRLQADC